MDEMYVCKTCKKLIFFSKQTRIGDFIQKNNNSTIRNADRHRDGGEGLQPSLTPQAIKKTNGDD